MVVVVDDADSIAIIAMVEDQHNGHKLSTPPPPRTSTSSPLLIDPLDDRNFTSVDSSISNNRSDGAEKSRAEPIETIFLTSKPTFHLPLIQQEKFQWDPVSFD